MIMRDGDDVNIRQLVERARGRIVAFGARP